jgi:transcriptional regulator with XRE-family HTH domain
MNHDHPTLRGEHLGEELRKLRKEAQLTLTVAGKHIDMSEPTMSLMESGKRSLKFEDVAGLLAIYGVNGEKRAAMLAMAREADQRGWTLRITQAQNMHALRRLEAKATKIVEFSPMLIPGLLQTTPYMLALFREAGHVSEEEALDRMTDRLQRQQVLRYPSPEYVAMIDEMALRRRVGGRQVLREQLTYLTEAAQRPKISVRVVPNLDRAHGGLDGGYRRLHVPDRTIGVVHVDNRVYSQFLEEEDDAKAYDKVTEDLLALALDEADSVRLIAGIAEELKGEAGT